MIFDELDRKMRIFETTHDVYAPADAHLVARLDGRSFTRLTKEEHRFEAPFDERFRDLMVGTAQHLMQCGLNVPLAYTQSDEISLLLASNDSLFGRKLRKLNSVLAGEASATFALLLGSHAAFDCRVSILPERQTIVDYFRWRSEDASRNSLSAHCYWRLRKEGSSAREATRAIEGLDKGAKIELLSRHGFDFEKIPGWQRRGTLLFWQTYEKEGFNPVTGERTTATRRRIGQDGSLPSGPALSAYFEDLLDEHYSDAD